MCQVKKWSFLLLLVGMLVLLASTVRSSMVVASSEKTVYLPLVGKNIVPKIADPSWVSPFGVVMYEGINDANGLMKMRTAGATWVVTMLRWDTIQPSASAALDTWNWSAYDTQMLNAQNAGMDVFVLVFGIPAWAQGSNPLYQYPGGGPTMDKAALAGFAQIAAERYDGDGGADDAPGHPVVKYWSFLAEPDYCGHSSDLACAPRPGEELKGMFGRSGLEYAQLMQLVKPAIKAANPSAVVINGGIAFASFNIYRQSFMANVIANGGASGMEALAIHYYTVTSPTWADNLRMLYETASGATRTTMQGLPLISPEMGYWSGVDTNNDLVPDGTDEHGQAVRLVQMFTSGLANGMQRMAWFAVFDGSAERYTELHGLFRGSDLNQPKEAYFAYNSMTSQLYGFRFSTSLHSENNPSPAQWAYEAYQFQRQADGVRRIVAWANPGSTVEQRRLAVQAQSVTVANMLGSSMVLIYDGGAGDVDGAVNGSIFIQLTQEPAYITIR